MSESVSDVAQFVPHPAAPVYDVAQFVPVYAPGESVPESSAIDYTMTTDTDDND